MKQTTLPRRPLPRPLRCRRSLRHAEAAKLVYLGLSLFKHRGQESAGIVSTDGHESTPTRAWAKSEFSLRRSEQLPGTASIGHTRYSTAATKLCSTAQPIMIDCTRAQIALRHNGNLTNAAEWRPQCRTSWLNFPKRTSDTEVVVHLVSKITSAQPLRRPRDALNQVEGAYSLVVLTPKSFMQSAIHAVFVR